MEQVLDTQISVKDRSEPHEGSTPLQNLDSEVWKTEPPDRYRILDKAAQIDRLESAYAFLLEHNVGCQERLSGMYDRTLSSIQTIYTQAENPTPEIDGVFVVPTMLRSGRNGYAPYSDELRPFFPLIDELALLEADNGTNWIAHDWAVGLPPALIQQNIFHHDDQELNIGVVYIPISSDIFDDLGSTRAMRYIKVQIENAVTWGNRMGARFAGYGATLPIATGLCSDRSDPFRRLELGKSVTGHATTIATMAMACESYFDLQEVQAVGVLGTGNIGAAFSEFIRFLHPDIDLVLYDSVPAKSNRLREKLTSGCSGGNVIAANSMLNLLKKVNLVVSAVTGPVNLPEVALPLLERIMFIEDSAPPWLPDEQIIANGGGLSGVFCRPPEGLVRAHPDPVLGCNHDLNTGHPDDLYGCQAELILLTAGLLEQYSGSVQQEKIYKSYNLLKRLGFSASLQHNGSQTLPQD